MFKWFFILHIFTIIILISALKTNKKIDTEFDYDGFNVEEANVKKDEDETKKFDPTTDTSLIKPIPTLKKQPKGTTIYPVKEIVHKIKPYEDRIKVHMKIIKPDKMYINPKFKVLPSIQTPYRTTQHYIWPSPQTSILVNHWIPFTHDIYHVPDANSINSFNRGQNQFHRLNGKDMHLPKWIYHRFPQPKSVKTQFIKRNKYNFFKSENEIDVESKKWGYKFSINHSN